MKNVIDEVTKLYKRVRNIILCGTDEDGFPTAKAVLPSNSRISLSEMYFCTNTSSEFVKRIANNCKSSVYFFDPIFYKGCLLKGEMEIVDDNELKAKFWKIAMLLLILREKSLVIKTPIFVF